MGVFGDRERLRVRLSAGRHRSPADGACVMEVASMLAAEPFSDRPRCVSPSIAAYLRAYNDGAPERLRADLYRVAAKVVGSRAGERRERLRERRCRELVVELGRSRTGWRARLPWPAPRSTGPESAGDELGEAVLRLGPDAHERALAIVDELLWVGAPRPAPTPVWSRLLEPGRPVSRPSAATSRPAPAGAA